MSRGQWIAALSLLSAIVVLGAGGLIAWIRRWGAPVRVSRDTPPEAPRAQKAAELVCPSCTRRYPAAARFCAIDATPLVTNDGGQPAPPLVCPRCDVSYERGVRFCPVDAAELVHVAAELGEPDEEIRHHHADGLAGSDKICPVCAARYEVAAAYCGRDGTRLMPLH